VRGFLVIQVRADISDVRVREADNLPGVAGVRENFLIAGDARVENNFTAAADLSSRRAAVKYPPVLERESCGPWMCFRQRDLPGNSLQVLVRR